MSDLLIRNIDPKLKRELEKRAGAHGQSLSDEAKSLLRKSLIVPETQLKMGTWLSNLVPAEYRGDDLVFESGDEGEKPPPDFE